LVERRWGGRRRRNIVAGGRSGIAGINVTIRTALEGDVFRGKVTASVLDLLANIPTSSNLESQTIALRESLKTREDLQPTAAFVGRIDTSVKKFSEKTFGLLILGSGVHKRPNRAGRQLRPHINSFKLS